MPAFATTLLPSFSESSLKESQLAGTWYHLRDTRPGERPPHAWRRASEFFCQQILQSDVVEHGVGQKPLQLRVLVLERPQPPRLRHVHAAVLRLPGIERRRA